MLIPGPTGKLEALLDWDPEAEPRRAAVVCHPHPLHGCTLHNKVVYRATKAAVQAGLVALRFNFRGVGESEGEYDEGRGEREDVSAALDYLEARFPRARAVVMGFSFGAWVGMAEGVRVERLAKRHPQRGW